MRIELRRWLGVAVAAWATACGSAAATDPGGETGGNGTDSPLSSYFQKPSLCNDASGPDCTKLRLGDAYLTTTTPARGALFACSPGNASAPGSIQSRITWIDYAASTWDILRKPWLPAGQFAPAGSFSMMEQGTSRIILVNNLPVDGRIGNWPMTSYAALTSIDPNPGVPAARTYSFNLALYPLPAEKFGCVTLGAIGVTLNGVVFYNAADARGNDAVAHEIVDVYGGHPASSEYHYHFVPEHLDTRRLADGHSDIVGYIRDGYPIYGYRGVGGAEMSNADLDECHGHEHGSLGYHYHATIEYPYTIGCYKGTPR
jgi:hypothetical protein